MQSSLSGILNGKWFACSAGLAPVLFSDESRTGPSERMLPIATHTLSAQLSDFYSYYEKNKKKYVGMFIFLFILHHQGMLRCRGAWGGRFVAG